MSAVRQPNSLRRYRGSPALVDLSLGNFGACGGFGCDAFAFADLRRRCSGSSSEMLVRMLENLVDHTLLRTDSQSLQMEQSAWRLSFLAKPRCA